MSSHGVFLVVGAAALQRKGDGRRDEIDDQEGEEEEHQFVEAGGSVESGWKCFWMKYQIVPTANMMSMSGDTSGSRIWKITMLGRATHPSAPLRAKTAAMLVDGLQDSERPAETLAHQAIRVGGSLGVGECHVFVLDAISAAQQRHGQVGIFGDGISVVASSLAHGGDAPRADRAGNDADRA